MEKYVYYSIILCLAFLFFLYIYLLYEKMLEVHYTKKKNLYSKEIIPFIDELITFLDTKDIDDFSMSKLYTMVKDKTKRNILSERLIYYIELFSGSMRNRIIRVCEDIGLVDYEIANLKGKDYLKIALACKRLGEYRSLKSLQPVIDTLNKGGSDIKYHGLKALAKIGDPYSFIAAMDGLKKKFTLSERSLTEIVDSFEGDKVSLYRKMMRSANIYISTIFIKSAGNYMNSILSPDIAEFLNDFSKDRKIAAIKAIGQIGDTRYVDDIISALNDSEWEVRAIAAKSLGRLNDGKALFPLVNSLSDKEWWVRYNSAWSIIQIPGGIDVVAAVLEGSDRFAKDILISAIESSGIIDNIYDYENSPDDQKKRLSVILKTYKLKKELLG